MGFEVVVLVLLALLVAAQLGMYFMQSRRLQQLEKSLALTSAAHQELLGAAGKSLSSLQGSISGLERRLVRTAQRQHDIQSKSAGSLTYEQAAKLVQMGAAPEDLVKSCGLSQSEAKLVSLMAARGIVKAS